MIKKYMTYIAIVAALITSASFAVTRDQANQEDSFRRVMTPMMMNVSQNDGETVSQSFTNGVPAKLSTGANVRYLEGFGFDTPNNRFYLAETGVTDRKFKMQASMTVKSDTGATLFHAYLYVNGSPVPGIAGAGKSANANDEINVAVCGGIVELSTNDYIELYVKTSTTGSVTLSHFIYLIIEDGR